MGFPGMNYSNKNRVKGQRPGMGQAPPSPYMGGPAGGGDPNQSDPAQYHNPKPPVSNTPPPGSHPGPRPFPPGRFNPPNPNPGTGGRPPGYLGPPVRNRQVQGGFQGAGPGFGGVPGGPGGAQDPPPQHMAPPPGQGPDPIQLAEMLPWNDPRSPHYQGGPQMAGYGQMEDTAPSYFPYANMLAGY